MIAFDQGFRFGAKKTSQTKDGNWVHVQGTSKAYEEVRADPYRLKRLEDSLFRTEQKLRKLLDAVMMARILLSGGLVRKDKIAATDDLVSASMNPEQLAQSLGGKVAE